MHPKVFLSGARAAYLGSAMDLEPHRNAVATLIIGLNEPFRLMLFTSPEAGDVTQRIALIPPQTMHHLRAKGRMLFLYLDALSDDYLAMLDNIRSLENRVPCLRELIDSYSGSAPVCMLDALFAEIGLLTRKAVRPGLEPLVRRLDRDPQHFESISMAADALGLSASRFQHVFRDEIGIPFRRYRLWRRMAIVFGRLQKGDSLTQAAMHAGFSSSAHLSSTFKLLFGISPSDLISLGTVIAGAEVDEDTPLLNQCK